jgi:branched-chain amino acid transport system permease protein
MREQSILTIVVERIWPVAVIIAVLLLITVLASLSSQPIQRVVIDGLIKVVVVVGIYIFVGNSGVLSFGHIGFMAIGAYVSAWMTMAPSTKQIMLSELPTFLSQIQIPTIPGAIVGGLAASSVALIVGFPLMRLSGISASIGTFAVLATIIGVIGNWDAMTGGKSSLIGIPIDTDITMALGWALVTIAVAAIYQHTRFGMLLRGTREDQVAARASGINVPFQRLIAFVISAFFVAIGGALFGHFLGILTADSFFLGLTFITLAMLVIGGMQSLTGAVTGVIVVSTLTEALRQIETGIGRPGLQEVGLAIGMLLILIFRPKGLIGHREIPLPEFLSRRVNGVQTVRIKVASTVTAQPQDGTRANENTIREWQK